MKKTTLFLALAVLTPLTLAETPPARMTGDALVDAKGMTLYVFDKDQPGTGKSACTGQCATNWPPLTAMESDKSTGDFTVITRDDGKKQWTYKGKPLYYWSKDQKPGDRGGDGVNQVWHVAK